MIISWGKYLSPLIMDESWCHQYQNASKDSANIKIFLKFTLEVGKIKREVANLSIFINFDDFKASLNWFQIIR